MGLGRRHTSARDRAAGVSTITLPGPAGRALELSLGDPADHIPAMILRRRRFYELDLLEDLCTRAAPGLVIDVGAHLGNHTVWLAAAGFEVLALEPAPAYELLCRNVARNGLAPRVRALQVAASREPGWGRLAPLRTGNTGMTAITDDPMGTIALRPVDQILDELRAETRVPRVTVIKVDVEQAELAVLEGARQTIVRDRPLLYVEADGDARHAAVTAFLAPLGYREFGRYAITPTYGFAHESALGDGTPTVSVAIMAHPDRGPFVADLCARLDGTAHVIWDQCNSRWDTGRRSLLAFGPGATHHLVIQDDALPARDLLAGVTNAVRAQPRSPISFYLGKHRVRFVQAMEQARRQRSPWITASELCTGVAVVLPTAWIPAVVAWGDQQSIENYDVRLSGWCEQQGIPVLYSVPSLVDHRRGDTSPSLIPGRTSRHRVAYHFLGMHRSATGLRWTGPAVAVRPP